MWTRATGTFETELRVRRSEGIEMCDTTNNLSADEHSASDFTTQMRERQREIQQEPMLMGTHMQNSITSLQIR
jgi:hypothetical protein